MSPPVLGPYSPNHFKSVGATLLQSLLVAAAVVPGCVAFWGRWPPGASGLRQMLWVL